MGRRVFGWLTGAAWVVGLTGCAPQNAATSGLSLTFLQAPISAQGLVGSTPQILNAEFGQPVLRRIDGTAQVWLYHSQVCGLNLILYPDSSGTPRVSMAVPDNNDPARCVASLERAPTTAAAVEPPSAS
jgi:hypothetical protein